MALAGSLGTSMVLNRDGDGGVVPECLSLPRDFGAIMGWFVKESYWHLELSVEH